MTLGSLHRWLPLGVVGVVLALFAPVLGFSFVLWDDPQYILRNPLVDPQVPWPADGWLTPALGYPIPVTIGLYRAVATLAGVMPAPFHALNLGLHALNAWLFCRLLLGCVAVPWAWVGGLLWALHPLVVEPVAWATATKDLLYATGFLALLLGAARPGRLPAWVLPLAVATMLAKPTAVVLPAVLGWTLWSREGRGGLTKPGAGLQLVVMAVVAAAVLAGGLLLAAGAPVDGYATVDGSFGGVGERLAAILEALDLQVRHTLWPVGLQPQYFRHPGLGLGDAAIWRGVLWLVAIAAAAVWALRSPSGPARWWLGLAVLTYAPVSMLLPIKRFTCDSYAYVPLLCAVGAVVSGLNRLRWPARRIWVVGTALAVLLGCAARQELPKWQSSLQLWGTALAATPDHPMSQKRWAEALDGAGRRGEAWAFLQPHLPNLQREHAIDGMVLTLAATEAAEQDARALYAWVYAHQRALAPDVHRNFCTFVATHHFEPSPTELAALAQALDQLRRYHARRGETGALVALAALGGSHGLWAQSGALLEHAWLLGHQRAWATAAAEAYGRAGDREGAQRVTAQLRD